MSTSIRRPFASLAALGAAAVAAVALSAPALAAPTETTTPAPSPSATTPAATAKAPAAYRYWGYYKVDKGAWVFQEKGPYQVIATDGSVEGWRYATADMTTQRPPRALPTFEEICGKTAAETGKKRIGFVIDFGRVADGAEGAQPPAAVARCEVIPVNASSAQAMAAAASGLREEGGMVCAINGYPAKGCGDPVATVPAAASAPDDKIELALKGPRIAEETKAAEQAQAAEQAKAAASSGPSKKLLAAIGAGIVALAGAGAFIWDRRRKANPTPPQA